MKKKVSELRPTQFAVGMYEVQQKLKKIKGASDKELQAYLEAHPVPVVIARDGEHHLIDHHHLVRACWEAGVEKVHIEIKEDFSKLSDVDFWKEMNRLKWTHLFDQFGNGPHDPDLLPLDVRGLADDLYRSLAWAIREEGGFHKSETPFCEFKWADFLRKKLKIERTSEGFAEAVKKAPPHRKKLRGGALAWICTGAFGGLRKKVIIVFAINAALRYNAGYEKLIHFDPFYPDPSRRFPGGDLQNRGSLWKCDRQREARRAGF